MDFTKIKPEHKQMLRALANVGDRSHPEYMKAVAQVLEGAWKAGQLDPDLLGTIFRRIPVERGSEVKLPLDFYAPGTEGRYIGFFAPKEGRIPERLTEGDEIRIGTYKITNSISLGLDYVRDANWDVVRRALDVYNNGFIRKMNRDGWHVLLKTAANNSLGTLTDSSASSGSYTKGLQLNMMASIKRQSGGREARLTDIYLSPEAINDVRNFTDSVVDETTLRSLITNGEDTIPQLYQVRLHEMIEFGVDSNGVFAEYQDYLVNTLSKSLPASKAEFVVGLDLMHRDSFVMPVREEMTLHEDTTLLREMKVGWFGWIELGFAAIDTRRAILGAL